MPYTMKPSGRNFCVYKERPDGSRGELVKCHPTKDKALAHLAALESATRDEEARRGG